MICALDLPGWRFIFINGLPPRYLSYILNAAGVLFKIFCVLCFDPFAVNRNGDSRLGLPDGILLPLSTVEIVRDCIDSSRSYPHRQLLAEPPAEAKVLILGLLRCSSYKRNSEG